MVIKVIKKNKERNRPVYKSSKTILTSLDIKNAERFDSELKRILKKEEYDLLSSGNLLKKGQKKDPLVVWYKIGIAIKNFLKKSPVKTEDERIFWDNFYYYDIIHKSNPKTKISLNRNDFKTSYILSNYSTYILRKVGTWALWREMLSYKSIKKDSRILDWLIKELSERPRTRDEARPLLKAIAKRFKNIDTSILDKAELLEKIKESENFSKINNYEKNYYLYGRGVKG